MKREPNAKGDGEQLRAELVAAASELLLTTQSIALPSLRAVARACSVSPAAVYLHFASQRELLKAVVDAQIVDLDEFVRARVAAAGDGVVAAFAHAYADWAFEHPGGYQLLFESADELELEHSPDDDGMMLIRDGVEILASRSGLPLADAESTFYRMWSALHGLVSLRIHKADAEWPNPVDTEIDAILAAFVPSGALTLK
jgi:AcrR family transcriptional regulator